MAEETPGRLILGPRAAVLGHPIAHSLSPVLHRAAYAHLSLTAWRYDRFDVTEEGFAAFWAGLGDEWAGLSLTMPLKRVVRPYLHSESPLAAAIGSVNTVVFTPGGAMGENTDVHGIVAALGEAGVVGLAPDDEPLVLGGGATAASAVAAMAVLGARRTTLFVRSKARCAGVLGAADRLGVKIRLGTLAEELHGGSGGTRHLRIPLVISTLPAAASAEHAAALLAWSSGELPPLLDVAYDPWPTPLAAAWAARGGVIVSGFAMLVHQAAEQVRLMTGRPGPVDVMRAAGEAELARRHGA